MIKMKIPASRKRKMIMKSKLTSSSSYSYMVRRRLAKRRVKAAVFRASLKKKKQQQHHVDKAGSPDVQMRQPTWEEGGFLECAFGFCINGEFVQLTRGFLVNSAADLPPYYFPVVDNHGFLLGEFKKLDDDLSFVQEEETPVCYNSFLSPGLNF